MTPQYNEKDLVIANLLSRADQISKIILSAFKTDASHNDNATKLASLKPDIKCFETCADFLNIQLTKPDNVTALFSNKATIADRIVFAIEGLFPGKCEDCNETYSSPFDPPVAEEKDATEEDKDKVQEKKDEEEEPPIVLNCYTCFRASHADCVEMKEKLKPFSQLDSLPQGIVWLCHTCRESKNPVKPPKKTRTCSVTNSVPHSGTGTPATAVTLAHKINEEDLSNALNNLANQNRIEDDKEEEMNKKDEKWPKKDHDQNKPKPKICPKYKLRQCPHGRSGTISINGQKCPDPHPTRCRRYCLEGDDADYGCPKKAGDCKYWHPALCHYSLKKGHCSNKDCTFTHLRGTARGPIPREDNRRHDPHPGITRRDARPRFPSRSTAPSRDASRVDRNRRRVTTVTQKPRRGTTHEDPKEHRTTQVKTKEAVTLENAITTTSEPFLELMRLVTSLKEEHRKDQEERKFELSTIKTALHNMSLVSQNSSFPQMLMNHAPEKMKMSQQYTGVPAPPMTYNNYPTLSNYQQPSY